jgi:hypothetical protein
MRTFTDLRGPLRRTGRFLLLAIASTAVEPVPRVSAQQGESPPHQRDRGPGLPTSLFGTYIQKGELIVSPFFESYRDKDYEYAPAELGHGLDEDFRGNYRASEVLLYLGYGLTEDVAIELEAAWISAELETSPQDPTGIPDRIEESGLGDIEAQLRWRWSKETARRPEYFGYFETVFPIESDTGLIGTSDWELKLGGGLVKGFSWGTVTARIAVEYDAADSEVALGEAALEYLKRLSPAFRVFLGVEGTQDEIELLSGIQWHIRESVVLRLHTGIGLTSKATDWAPEVGVLFAIPLGSEARSGR